MLEEVIVLRSFLSDEQSKNVISFTTAQSYDSISRYNAPPSTLALNIICACHYKPLTSISQMQIKRTLLTDYVLLHLSRDK